MVPGVLSPRGCHFFFQSINSAAFSSSAEYVLASWPVIWMFFCNISTGSMPSFAAKSSSADIVIRHICGWLGARQARAGPMLAGTAVGNMNDVRDVGSAALRIGASRTPGFGRPARQRAVLFCAHFDFCIHRRAGSGSHQFLIALEHHLYGTSRLFGKPRAREPPSVGAEFAAKASAHDRREDAHFVRGVRDLCAHHFSGMPAEMVRAKIADSADKVRVLTPVMGGGFGSKFGADTWVLACARLAKKAGRPVKMMLERDQELLAAGARPSMYAKVKVGAKKDGTLMGWASESWGTGGPDAQGGAPSIPYVVRIPDRRVRHTTVLTNIGPARAWRAPNHPQMCLITMSALDDLAAKLGMDPVEM